MLKKFTLASLQETRLAPLFEEAVFTVEESMKDHDLLGKRTIKMTLTFEPDDRGYVKVDMTVKTDTPSRSIRSMAAMDGDRLQIDTVSDDVRQPDLLDEEAQGKVLDIKGKEKTSHA